MNIIHSQYDEAIRQLNAGNLREAEQIATGAYMLDPDNQDVMHLLAIIRCEKGDLNNALEFINSSINITPYPQFFNTKGNILVELGDNRAAEEAYFTALSLDPNQIESYSNISILLRKIDRTDEAIFFCNKALILSPNETGIINTLGLCHFDLNQFELAASYFQKAINTSPTYIMAHLNISRAWYSSGKVEMATQYLLALKEKYPDIYQVDTSLGNIYRGEGLYEKSISHYKNALLSDALNFDAHAGLGICLLAIGKVNKAVPHFQSALTTKPKDRAVIVNLCSCFSCLQDYPRISALLKKHMPLENAVDNADLHIYNAIFFWLSGDKNSTQKYLSLSAHPPEENLPDERNNFTKAYCDYLNALCKTIDPKNKNGLKEIYFIGDSHTLANNRQLLNIKGEKYFSETRLIIGCKIWHLINPHENEFKFSFKRAIESIPDNSAVAFNIGEIDCRENEGIILQLNDNESNLISICKSMASQYVEYIRVTANSKNISAYLLGIPAPIVIENTKLSDNQKKRIEIIRHLNLSLKHCCERIDSIIFINTYSITSDENGQAKPGFHLDNVHLSQTSYQLAFDNSIHFNS
ncbi:MAG: tetratricopeptide repeat protein [Gammaproteobacteria bacterium]|nr:tetratricopeptide repeat protein [Gammaproteobacteria bacterium]